MRHRWVYIDGQAVKVSADYAAPAPGVLIMADLPGYQSPVTGLWVDGRRQRREDLKRTQSRPYEGREQELKEAARADRYAEQKLDASLTKSAAEAFYQMSPEKRRVLEGR